MEGLRREVEFHLSPQALHQPRSCSRAAAGPCLPGKTLQNPVREPNHQASRLFRRRRNRLCRRLRRVSRGRRPGRNPRTVPDGSSRLHRRHFDLQKLKLFLSPIFHIPSPARSASGSTAPGNQEVHRQKHLPKTGNSRSTGQLNHPTLHHFCHTG